MGRKGRLSIIDDADVQRLAEFFLKAPEFAAASAETRAEIAYRLALGISKINGHSKTYSAELARKVRDRVLWGKPSN
jgi:hypothetical protein